MTLPYLEVVQIEKQYGGQRALAKCSLSLDEGKNLAILGTSGCGKSTLLSLIALLMPQSSGQLFYNGQDTQNWSAIKQSAFRLSDIAMVFQNFQLLSHLSVLDNTMLPLLYQDISRSQAKIMAKETLKSVDLAEHIKKYPKELSGGQQQRVALARALVKKPKLLLADEPTGLLDSKTSKRIEDLLFDLHETQGFGLITVTHDVNLAKRCQAILELVN